MLFSSELPLKRLILTCRALRHQLSAGIGIRKVFRQQAERGVREFRPIADRLSLDLEKGESLEDALEKEKKHFPPLFLKLVVVGERTGNLPEILGDLENYYVLQEKLWNQFIKGISYPVLMLFAADGVIAMLLLILGAFDVPMELFGLGKPGVGAAIRWVISTLGTVTVAVVVYAFLSKNLKHRAPVDRVLLRLPALGPCLQALALARFCLALRVTMETGMSIPSALRLTMLATGNAAFVAQTDVLVQNVKAGESLTTALSETGMFPYDFINIVATAEEGGRVPEMMEHQAKYYEEESARRLKTLTSTATGCVYVLYLIIMIFLIFSVWKAVYGQYDKILPPGY